MDTNAKLDRRIINRRKYHLGTVLHCESEIGDILCVFIGRFRQTRTTDVRTVRQQQKTQAL